MKLDEFPPNTKVHRESWRKGLYIVKTLQGKWVYIENGNGAGELSSKMQDYEDFEYYEKKDPAIAFLYKCPNCKAETLVKKQLVQKDRTEYCDSALDRVYHYRRS